MFNEDRYKRLMTGLECSEVNFRKLNSEFRIDSEYFLKQYIEDDLKISKLKNIVLGNFAFITDGQHGYHELDENSPIHMLTAKNTKNWFADIDGADTISKWVDDNNKRSALQTKDIIMSTRGTIGCCAMVFEDVLPANIDQDVARINVTKDFIHPEFLLIYLNTKFAKGWMQRNKTGMVQQGLSLEKVRQIPIPILSEIFQDHIQQILSDGHNAFVHSQRIYKEAEQILLSELSLDNFNPSTQNTSIKNFSAVMNNGRLDAEYYQREYDDIEEKITTMKNISAYDLLAENNQMYTPLQNEKYTYIELADIENQGNIKDDCLIAYGSELPSRARRQVATNDVIISSLEGSLGSCALIPKKYDRAICSTGFYVLRSFDINPETLLLLFKSKPIQMLMQRGCNGTILTAISLEELKKVPIPIPSESVQKQIAEKIQQSFELREQSKSLLKSATKAVEIAIEKDESAAMLYLQKCLDR